MMHIVEIIRDIFNILDDLRGIPEVYAFIDTILINIIFVGLAFGFAVLLVEIRLPLKYYWSLPTHMIRNTLSGFRLLKAPPVWGRCLENESKQPIPITAVELLDNTSKEVLDTTFSNRDGEYGFSVKTGEYIVRAVKNYYKAPPFYDPENIEMTGTDESIAIKVYAPENGTPSADLYLQPMPFNDTKPQLKLLTKLFRTFTINFANGMLAISILGSLYAWIITEELLYGTLIAVGIIFMFIKIYILEAVGSSSR